MLANVLFVACFAAVPLGIVVGQIAAHFDNKKLEAEEELLESL